MSSQAETISQPLCWTPRAPFEGNMITAVREWLNSHPELDGDSREIIVTRTLFERLDGNLYNAVLCAYPAEVSYDTVWGALVRNQKLTEDTPDYKDWLNAMDLIWSEAVCFFRVWFTKPPPRND